MWPLRFCASRATRLRATAALDVRGALSQVAAPGSDILRPSRLRRAIHATHPKMEPHSYGKWTKESLVKRIQTLEKQLKCLPPGPAPTDANGDQGAPTTEKKGKKRKESGVDPSKYSTRFIALKFAYLGKNYSGLEYSDSGILPSIEEELWKALVKACLIFPERPEVVDFRCCDYSKCGRTDRGVSAFGQVVSLRVRSNKPVRRKKVALAEGETNGAIVSGEPMDTEDGLEEDEPMEQDDTPLPASEELSYCRILNRLLPPDIKILAWCPAPPPGFDARFSCRERQYRYFFTQPAFAPTPEGLYQRGKGRIKDGWLDIDAMRRACKMFEGSHDFRNFCKIDTNKLIDNFVRRIYEADIVEVEDTGSALPFLADARFREETLPAGTGYPKVYSFDVKGSAFLWHQIRHMVAIIFLVGQGLESPSIVEELLDVEKHPRKPNYVLASDVPLVLWDCKFEKEDQLEWVYTGEDNPQDLYGPFGLQEGLWEYWREKKMDEFLASRFFDLVSRQTSADKASGEGSAPRPQSQKVFEGGNLHKSVGTYVPVMKKSLLPLPEEKNDGYARRKGFASAEEMRGTGNWLAAVRAAKAAGKDGGDE